MRTYYLASLEEGSAHYWAYIKAPNVEKAKLGFEQEGWSVRNEWIFTKKPEGWDKAMKNVSPPQNAGTYGRPKK